MGRRSKYGMSRGRWGRENKALRRFDSRHGASPNLETDTVVVEMMSFEITNDSFDDPYVEALPPEFLDETVALINQSHRNPVKDLPKVLSLIDQGVRVPKLYNYAFVGYMMSGQEALAREVVEETCRLFPDYFFGKLEKARFLLHEGDLVAAKAALGNTFSLTRLCNSDRVHFSVFKAWCTLMCEFQIAEQHWDAAESYRDMLESVDPEDEAIDYMDHLIKKGQLEHLLECMDAAGERIPQRLKKLGKAK